jgi:hypothetical protein
MQIDLIRDKQTLLDLVKDINTNLSEEMGISPTHENDYLPNSCNDALTVNLYNPEYSSLIYKNIENQFNKSSL